MSGEVISLNVGGTIFTTTVSTLTQYPDSMLAAMFDPESERPPAREDGQGNYFIDGEPEPFKFILRFLRRGKLSEDIVGCSLEQVEWEADYFGLGELLKIIGERKKAEKRRAEEKEIEECEEKAAEMRKRLADAMKMHNDCKSCNRHSCDVCFQASESACKYRSLAREYEKKAADLRGQK